MSPASRMRDVRDHPRGKRREMERLAVNEGRRPFDLAAGPMLRTTLLRLGGTEHALLLTMHHIAADGWTIGILIRELAANHDVFDGAAEIYLDACVELSHVPRDGASTLSRESHVGETWIDEMSTSCVAAIAFGSVRSASLTSERR